jgi:hypothetical protein
LTKLPQRRLDSWLRSPHVASRGREKANANGRRPDGGFAKRK